MTQALQMISLAQGIAPGCTAQNAKFCLNDLIHWRDPRKSGVVFGLSLMMLLSLAWFSIISVISYLLLVLLSVGITFRVYHFIVQAVQKCDDEHPFQPLLEMDVSIPPEVSSRYVDATLVFTKQALRLFLVEDLMESLKLAVVMWMFTYVGAIFNGITLLILADILLFAIPPFFEHKTQIYPYIDMARAQVMSTLAKLQEKIPKLQEKFPCVLPRVFPSVMKRFKAEEKLQGGTEAVSTESQPESSEDWS